MKDLRVRYLFFFILNSIRNILTQTRIEPQLFVLSGIVLRVQIFVFRPKIKTKKTEPRQETRRKDMKRGRRGGRRRAREIQRETKREGEKKSRMR